MRTLIDTDIWSEIFKGKNDSRRARSLAVLGGACAVDCQSFGGRPTYHTGPVDLDMRERASAARHTS
jgi:hypothetical protein